LSPVSQEEWSTSSGPIPQSGQLPEESDVATALVPPRSVDAEGVKEKVEVNEDVAGTELEAEPNENNGAAALDAESAVLLVVSAFDGSEKEKYGLSEA